MYNVFKFVKVALLSNVFLPSSPSFADESGFQRNFGFDSRFQENYALTIPTVSLIGPNVLLENDLLRQDVRMSFAKEAGVHASLSWRSRAFTVGSADITFGSSITGSYNTGYLNGDLIDTLEQTRQNLINYVTDEASVAFAPYNEPLGIPTSRSTSAFNDIAAYIVREAYLLQPITNTELMALVPDNLPEDATNHINNIVIPAIVDASQEINDSHFMEGLRSLNENVDYSGPTDSVSVAADINARATFNNHMMNPYVQLGYGHQATLFITHEENGTYFYGQTGYLEIGISGEFDRNTGWGAFVNQPFSFEQKGPDGLTAQSDADLSVGFNITRHNQGANVNIETNYTPETKNTFMGIKFIF